MFLINNDAIKLTNIKSFGIGSTDELYKVRIPIYHYDESKEKTGSKVSRAFDNFIYFLQIANDVEGERPEHWKNKLTFINKYKEIECSLSRNYYQDSKKQVHAIIENEDVQHEINKEDLKNYNFDIIKKPIYYTTKYLYITTFQNDNYRYHSNEINVRKEFNRLKKMMNG